MNTFDDEGMTEGQPKRDAWYRIGAVVQHTGLPASTIRTWERRYAAVHPQRSSGGGRLYSEDDVERLQLLKALVQRRDAIGRIADLSNEALLARLRKSTGPREPSGHAPLRVALLHGTLGTAFREHGPEFGHWEIVVDANGPDAFLDAVAEAHRVDVFIAELSRLGPRPEDIFERCVEAVDDAIPFVAYHFAPREVLESLGEAGARLLRAPVALSTLKRLVLEETSSRGEKLLWDSDVRSEPEPRSPAFDERQLLRLRSIESAVECECPHHLAHIIETLVAFERYSATCESRSPEDATLHRALRRGTGTAREKMEALLADVLEHEGITI